jgi:hypothetical protein
MPAVANGFGYAEFAFIEALYHSFNSSGIIVVSKQGAVFPCFFD